MFEYVLTYCEGVLFTWLKVDKWRMITFGHDPWFVWVHAYIDITLLNVSSSANEHNVLYASIMFYMNKAYVCDNLITKTILECDCDHTVPLYRVTAIIERNSIPLPKSNDFFGLNDSVKGDAFQCWVVFHLPAYSTSGIWFLSYGVSASNSTRQLGNGELPFTNKCLRLLMSISMSCSCYHRAPYPMYPMSGSLIIQHPIIIIQ